MSSIKKYFLPLILSLLCTTGMQAANIFGRVTDASGEPLVEATIKLLNARDSSFVKGSTSDIEGRFRLNNVNNGKFIIQYTYIGYNTAYTDIVIDNKDRFLRPIAMTESSIVLDEATVVGVKTQITVKEDTVEFNADSYKTQPNAVVEDLLKRLPGVEVDSEGKITANGKEVTKILVDGKEFFSDDPKVASKNLPVDMVDKLQVVDRKSDLARLTGVDDGEDETVINLTVKKGMKNGWFGTVEAGYGTDDRYKVGFNVNRFWNDNQITFIGSANNINELGFTDGGGRFRRFGGNNGINTSQAFGINFNVGNKEIFRVGGDLMYSHSDKDTRQRQDRQYLFTDSTSFVQSNKLTRDKGHNIRGDFRLQWNRDSFNTFEFRPNFSVNINNSNSIDSSLTLAGDAMRSQVTKSFNRAEANGTSYEFRGQIIYNHKFRSRPGRSFSIHANYSMSNVYEDEFTYSYNRFFLLDDSLDIYDQWADNHTWNNTVQGRISWTEPLGDAKNGRFLTFAYRMQYRWNNADKLVYDLDSITGEYSLFNSDLSNSFRNDFMNQDIRIGFQQVKSNYNLNVGLTFAPSRSSSKDLINSARDIPTRWVWNVAPFLRYRYKMSKSRSLHLMYNGRTSQPSMAQLQPVADMSDPLRIVIGNPNLNPTFTHSVRLRFQDFNMEKQRSIMAMADVQVAQNSIISKTTFDQETGGQTTTYTNVNGVWNARLMNMISLPFRNKAWQFHNNIFAMYNSTVGFNNGIRNRSGSLMASESFGISFRPDNTELELRPFYNIQTTHNTVQTSANRIVHTYGGYFNGTYYTPFGVVLNTDLSYSATSGYSAGYDTKQWMWNASVSYQFLKGKAATISLKVYDLLQQKENIRRSVTANYIDDISYNSLTRYFMATFTYKFNTFGKGNEPNSRNRRMGPGMPPPPMR